MRNYPKVLPSVPDDTTEYVSSALIKRRSMPPQYFSANTDDTYAAASVTSRFPPAPPPRISSTLGRGSKRDSNLTTTSPLMMALEPPAPVLDPEISYNVLHVGPLLPQSTESIYSTVMRTPRSPLRTLTPQFTFGECDDTDDSALKPSTMTTSTDPSNMPTATTATAQVHHHSSGILRPPTTGHRSSTVLGTRNITAPRLAQRMPALMRQISGENQKTHRISVHSILEEGSSTMPTTPPPTGNASSTSGDSSSSASSLSVADTVKKLF